MSVGGGGEQNKKSKPMVIISVVCSVEGTFWIGGERGQKI